MKNVKIRKLVFYIIFIVLFGFFLARAIPDMINDHKKNDILQQIQQVELKIEANKQERLNCEANMKLWNNDNEKNRGIINELKTKYNSMVGFTSAWQPEMSK